MTNSELTDYLETLISYMQRRKPCGPHYPTLWEVFAVDYPTYAKDLETWKQSLHAPHQTNK